DTSEGEQERPSRKIGERGDLFFIEELIGSKNRDQQKAEHKLWKFLPKKRGTVGDGFGFALAGPIDGVGEHYEADHGVASGLGEHGEFACGVGIKSTGRGRLG